MLAFILEYKVKKLPKNAHPADKKVVEDIKKYGWHVVNVLEEENHPPHSFSIGLYESFNHPEIIIIGIDNQNAQNIINGIGTKIKNGEKFESGKGYGEFLTGDYKCFFIKVEKSNYKGEYVGFASWYYEGDNFPLLQCVWPAKDGTFPWNKGYPKYLLKIQPLLGKK